MSRSAINFVTGRTRWRGSCGWLLLAMAYRGHLQQDVNLREDAELRRLEGPVPMATCLQCAPDGGGGGGMAIGAATAAGGGGTQGLLLVGPDAVLGERSDTLPEALCGS